MFLNGIIFFLFYNLQPNHHHRVYYWTPHAAFTGSFPNIVFVQYVRQGVGEITSFENTEYVCRCRYLIGNLTHGVVSVSGKRETRV